MPDLELIKQNPSRFLSMTSLTLEEFELVYNRFEGYCKDYFKHHTLQGKRRIKPCYGDQKNGLLQGSEMKLFFLISYMKNYPLQQYHGAYFGITQAKVSQLIKVLRPLLEKTLTKMGLVPTSDPWELKVELEKHQVKQANMDATEREVNRSTDYSVQKEFYSGKKKDIPLKTIY